MDIFRDFEKSRKISKDIAAGRMILDHPDGSQRTPTRRDTSDTKFKGCSCEEQSLTLSGNQSTKESSQRPNYCLPIVEAINLAVVFEDFGDALDVLGRSIDGPEIELRTKSSIEFDAKSHRPTIFKKRSKKSAETETSLTPRPAKGSKTKAVKPKGAQLTKPSISDLHTFPELRANISNKHQKYFLKQNYESKLPYKIGQLREQRPASHFNRRLSEAITECYMSNFTANGKIKEDKAFTQRTVNDIMVEMVQRSSFNSLIAAIENQQQVEAAREAKINRVAQLEDRRRALAREIKQVQTDKIEELKQCERVIWELEDEHQETRSRLGASQNYVINEARMIKQKSNKRCKKEAQYWIDKKDNMEISHRLETQVHFSMKEFIMNEIDRIQGVADMWFDKYTNDKENLQNELDILKSRRAFTSEHRKKIEKLYKEKYLIVADYRRMRKIKERRRKRSELEHKKATLLSAWWKGTMVRHGLGSAGRMLDSMKKEEKTKK